MGVADRNFKRPCGPRLPTTWLRVTGLMLPPSLGAAWLAWAARPVQGCPPPVARNRPYVASKLRGRVAGLGYLGHQQASAQSLWPVPGHPASEPRRPHGAHAGLRWSLGQAGPYRLAHRSMKSGLILEFTAGWTAQAAPAPQAAARSDTAPAQHAPGATGSSQ
jgi:hypothetical protein